MDAEILKQYQAVKSAAGLLDLSRRGKIRVTGADAKAVLHNILTQDIQVLEPGQGAYAALLNAKGQVLADMNVYVLENEILLDVEEDRDEKTAALIERYIITEDAKTEVVTSAWAHLSLQGPRSAAILTDFFSGMNFDFSGMAGASLAPALSRAGLMKTSREWHHREAAWQDVPVQVICKTHTGETGYDLLIPAKAAPAFTEKLLAVGKSQGLVPVSEETREILRIEAGILRYGRDFDETVLLPETGLEKIAASATKGCYPGQEVVARIDTYGGLNRKIVKLLVEGKTIPASGSRIEADQKEAGKVLSAAWSPALNCPAALGLLTKGFFEQPREFSIQTGGEMLKARAQPFS